MRHVFFILILITIGYNCQAANQDRAVRKAIEAVSKTNTVQKAIAKIEKILIEIIPISRETAITIGSTAIMIGRGKIGTKEIKNLDVEMWGGKIRPDINYNFRKGRADGKLKYTIYW